MIDSKQKILPRIGQTSSQSLPGSRHIVRWTEWGDVENPNLVFCAHGLSRNSRDFDYLARTLAPRYRVVCPDYPGRGASDWLTHRQCYNNEQYLNDTLAILDTQDFQTLDWIGTSMGGLIGMALASRDNSPIHRMVINDVGPFIPGAALREIGDYLGKHPTFDTLDDAMEYYRTVYASFGALEEHHYRHIVTHGVRESSDGSGLILSYDPAIIDQYTTISWEDIDLWEVWDRIRIPVLVLRGKQSQLLLAQTVEQMKHRHDKTESVEFDGCAHAPSLMVEDQITIINDWLRRRG